jgi:hypothetical protein
MHWRGLIGINRVRRISWRWISIWWYTRRGKAAGTGRESTRGVGSISHHFSPLGSGRHGLAVATLGEVVAVWGSHEGVFVGSKWRRERISLLIWRQGILVCIVGVGYMGRCTWIVWYAIPLPSSLSRMVGHLHFPATAIPEARVVVYLIQIGD